MAAVKINGFISVKKMYTLKLVSHFIVRCTTVLYILDTFVQSKIFVVLLDEKVGKGIV